MGLERASIYYFSKMLLAFPMEISKNIIAEHRGEWLFKKGTKRTEEYLTGIT